MERKVDRARNVPIFEFIRITNVHDRHGVRIQLLPVSQGQITTQMVCCDHSCVIHRVLRRAKLRSVAEFRFLEIEHRTAQLNRGRDHVDTLIDVDFANCLRAENAPIGFAEDEFDVDWLRTRKIAHMVPWMQIDLFVIANAGALEALLGGSRTCNLQTKHAADRGPLHAAEPRVASAN